MKYSEKHWWQIFIDSKKDDSVINPIIQDIKLAEENLNREKILKIDKDINSLDKEKYSEEIRNLKKRCNVLENRMERQVSDDFGTTLRFLRKKKRLSLSQLGEMTGISPSYINRLELKQRKSPSINIMESLAMALDVPLTVLADAAGIEFNNSKKMDIISLINQNKITLGYYDDVLDDNQKEKLVELIEFISESEWESNKEEESTQLIELMDGFKKELNIKNLKQ